jgi:hypothetical protein
MSKQSIRFGINDSAGNCSATWKCWSPTGVGKHDVYLVCRELGHVLHASLHQPGQWHITYEKQFFEENIVDPKIIEQGRFIEEWPRPSEISPGVTLAFRIVTPWVAVDRPYDETSINRINWIPNVSKGKATEIDIIITNPATFVSDWPRKRSANALPLDSMKLDSGEIVWIVYLEVRMPAIMPAIPREKTHPSYYKGKNKEDLQDENMHMLVFGDHEDGSKVIYDCTVKVKEEIEQNNKSQ